VSAQTGRWARWYPGPRWRGRGRGPRPVRPAMCASEVDNHRRGRSYRWASGSSLCFLDEFEVLLSTLRTPSQRLNSSSSGNKDLGLAFLFLSSLLYCYLYPVIEPRHAERRTEKTTNQTENAKPVCPYPRLIDKDFKPHIPYLALCYLPIALDGFPPDLDVCVDDLRTRLLRHNIPFPRYLRLLKRLALFSKWIDVKSCSRKSSNSIGSVSRTKSLFNRGFWCANGDSGGSNHCVACHLDSRHEFSPGCTDKRNPDRI
jgi:hypothetical protein